MSDAQTAKLVGARRVDVSGPSPTPGRRRGSLGDKKTGGGSVTPRWTVLRRGYTLRTLPLQKSETLPPRTPFIRLRPRFSCPLRTPTDPDPLRDQYQCVKCRSLSHNVSNSFRPSGEPSGPVQLKTLRLRTCYTFGNNSFFFSTDDKVDLVGLTSSYPIRP